MERTEHARPTRGSRSPLALRHSGVYGETRHNWLARHSPVAAAS
ncbi:hypothetical protein [Marinobacter sp. ELB17]|nr:hypothetical protein [Marinobacter sp. ELB17]